MISFKYTRTNFLRYFLSTWFINRWKVAEALQSPKGILFHSNSPQGVMKAVTSLDFGSISTCQYPLAKSSEVNHPAPPKLANISVCQGIGYWFFLVTSFVFLKSRHIHRLPSFFPTITIGVAQGLIDSLMMPFSSNSSSSFLSQFQSLWSIGRHPWAIGVVLSKYMVCWMMLVLANSFTSV